MIANGNETTRSRLPIYQLRPAADCQSKIIWNQVRVLARHKSWRFFFGKTITVKPSEAYPSRLHQGIDYLDIEPAGRVKNAIMKIEPTSNSKNTANGFNVKTIDKILIFEMTGEFK